MIPFRSGNWQNRKRKFKASQKKLYIPTRIIMKILKYLQNFYV